MSTFEHQSPDADSEHPDASTDYRELLNEARQGVHDEARQEARARTERQAGDPRFDPAARVQFLEQFKPSDDRAADIDRFLNGTGREEYLRSAAHYGHDINEYVREIIASLEDTVNAKPGDLGYHDVDESDPTEDANMVRWMRQIPRLELALLRRLTGEEQHRAGS